MAAPLSKYVPFVHFAKQAINEIYAYFKTFPSAFPNLESPIVIDVMIILCIDPNKLSNFIKSK
ncbi:MAG: hypothetical protein CML67_01630 [Rhodobacteraceae bacterium]|nr:hypothetical protein [Paracoccaceae bacterium]